MSNTGTVIAAVLVGAAIGYGASKIPTPDPPPDCIDDHYIRIDLSGGSKKLPRTCVSLSKKDRLIWQTESPETDIGPIQIPDWTDEPTGVNANPYPNRIPKGSIVLSGPMRTTGLQEGMEIRYSVKVGTGTFFGHIIIKK